LVKNAFTSAFVTAQAEAFAVENSAFYDSIPAREISTS
jgi:hypothetical protein